MVPIGTPSHQRPVVARRTSRAPRAVNASASSSNSDRKYEAHPSPRCHQEYRSIRATCAEVNRLEARAGTRAPPGTQDQGTSQAARAATSAKEMTTVSTAGRRARPSRRGSVTPPSLPRSSGKAAEVPLPGTREVRLVGAEVSERGRRGPVPVGLPVERDQPLLAVPLPQ